VHRIADAGPILFPPNCLLEFRCLAVVFRDQSFGLCDVDQRLPGRPPVGIRMIVCNSLFNVLSMRLRARQAFLQDGDQTNGYACVLVLRAKLLRSLRLEIVHAGCRMDSWDTQRESVKATVAEIENKIALQTAKRVRLPIAFARRC
jgi:hypothetical protein